jgi:uncharacterized membrane protein
MNYFSKARVEAFSDGVFAIIVTLLVLEIKLPDIESPNSAAELAGALSALLPKILSWAVSFLMVCVIWVNHHRILSQIEHITHSIFWLNATLLLWCSSIPFPTALLGDYPMNPVSSVVFGLVMALMAFTFNLLRRQALRDPDVLKPEVDRVQFRRATFQAFLFGPVLYSAGALLSFVSPWLSLGIFGFVPFYFILVNRSFS